MGGKKVEEWASLLYSINTQAMNGEKNVKKYYVQPAHSQLLYIHLHPSLYLSLSLCVIYLSVCGRIDSLLYSRPLKPGGDSPCQAAGSNEKLKEHINSSIWGHEDENSCQRPARNNWSHNAALLYVSEVMGVKQQLKTQGSENRVLVVFDRRTTLKILCKNTAECVIFKTSY